MRAIAPTAARPKTATANMTSISVSPRKKDFSFGFMYTFLFYHNRDKNGNFCDIMKKINHKGHRWLLKNLQRKL